jgi:anti-anti-sigma regulatory factor
MGTLLLKDSEGSKKITATGRLTIQEASTLKALLMEAYNTSGDLMLDLREAQGVDLACIQVLCSANIAFRKSGKRICITGELNGEITNSLVDIAMTPDTCESESPEQCLWLTGGRGDE